MLHSLTIYESNYEFYTLNSDRTYALVLNNNLDNMRFFYIDMLSAKYKIKFHMALHIEFEYNEDIDNYKQFLLLRSFFFINLKDYLIEHEIEGVWRLPADVFKKFIIEYFQLNPHDISLTKGDWSKDFDTTILNKS